MENATIHLYNRMQTTRKYAVFVTKTQGKPALNDYVNIIRAAGIIRRTLWPDNLLKCSKFLVAGGSVYSMAKSFFFCCCCCCCYWCCSSFIRLVVGGMSAFQLKYLDLTAAYVSVIDSNAYYTYTCTVLRRFNAITKWAQFFHLVLARPFVPFLASIFLRSGREKEWESL